MTNAISDLLLSHAGELLRPGWGRMVTVLILSYGVVVTALVLAWWFDGLRGRAGRVATTWLAFAGLLGSMSLGALAAAPIWARAATSFAGANVEPLKLAAPVGSIVLGPAVRAFTKDGLDDDALFAIERRGKGIDLAALTKPDGRNRAIAGITAARLRAEYDRAVASARVGAIPPWVLQRADALVDQEIAALVDAYPTLLGALILTADGTLPVALAEKQVTEALLTSVLPEHLERLLHSALGGTRSTIIWSWFGALVVCVLVRVGWWLAHRPRGAAMTELQ